MSLTSIFLTAKLALEMAEDAEKAAEAVTHTADDEAKAKAARDTLAAAKVSTIHAKAVVDSVYVMVELGTDTGTEIQNSLDKNPEQIQNSLCSIPEQNPSILDRNHLVMDDDENLPCENCKQSVCQHGKLLTRWKGMGDINNIGVKDTLTEKFGRVKSFSMNRNRRNRIQIQWDLSGSRQYVNLTTRKILYHCKDDINEANETEAEEESLTTFLSSAGDSVVNDEKDGNAVSDQLQRDPSDSTSKEIDDTVKTPEMFFENNLEGEAEGPMDDELEAENCMAEEPTEETDESSTAPTIQSVSALSTQNP